jgi:hypothetical protein
MADRTLSFGDETTRYGAFQDDARWFLSPSADDMEAPLEVHITILPSCGCVSWLGRPDGRGDDDASTNASG